MFAAPWLLHEHMTLHFTIYKLFHSFLEYNINCVLFHVRSVIEFKYHSFNWDHLGIAWVVAIVTKLHMSLLWQSEKQFQIKPQNQLKEN